MAAKAYQNRTNRLHAAGGVYRYERLIKKDMEGKPKAVRVRYKFCGAKESERDDNESY